MTSNGLKLKRDVHWLQNIKFEHLIAGISGGVSSTLVLHPFDLIKVRFQVNDGKTGGRPTYNGVADAFKSIFRQGGFRGLYQGVSPNIAGSGSAWGIYFFSFNYLKASLQEYQDVPALSPGGHLLIGATAGAATLAVTNPIWVVKTRMCLQPATPSGSVVDPKFVQYKGVVDGLLKLYKYEGIKGYYRGFIPGLFGVSHGAFQFMAYEELKKAHSKYTGTPVKKKLGAAEYLTMAALSKVFAVVTTYPYQVVRSRLQDSISPQKYDGVVDVFKKTWRFEGVLGFYKGLVPTLLRVTPACCITFLVYENVQHFLFGLREKEDGT